MESPSRILPMMLVALLAGGCAPGPEPAAQAPGPGDKLTYYCESGAKVVVSYPDTDSAIVEYEGHTYEMKIAVSGSGSRYVGDELEWWTKGSGEKATAALFTHLADGTSGKMVESCKPRPTDLRRYSWVAVPPPRNADFAHG